MKIRTKAKKMRGIDRGKINLYGANIEKVMAITVTNIVTTTSEAISIIIEAADAYS
jgi:hypothetical protein